MAYADSGFHGSPTQNLAAFCLRRLKSTAIYWFKTLTIRPYFISVCLVLISSRFALSNNLCNHTLNAAGRSRPRNDTRGQEGFLSEIRTLSHVWAHFRSWHELCQKTRRCQRGSQKLPHDIVLFMTSYSSFSKSLFIKFVLSDN